MGKKLIIGIIIVAFVIILGVVSVFLINNQKESPIAISPSIEFEATVVSLSLDDATLDDLALDESKPYVEGEGLHEAPSDSAIVRIDKIVETGSPYNFNWASLGIEEGNEVLLDFKYTVRPTKIITIVGETTRSGDVVAHRIVPTRITFEDNYFVFRENGNSETETMLFGLQEGFKFKTKLWKTFEVKVGMYEIIP